MSEAFQGVCETICDSDNPLLISTATSLRGQRSWGFLRQMRKLLIIKSGDILGSEELFSRFFMGKHNKRKHLSRLTKQATGGLENERQNEIENPNLCYYFSTGVLN